MNQDQNIQQKYVIFLNITIIILNNIIIYFLPTFLTKFESYKRSVES